MHAILPLLGAALPPVQAGCMAGDSNVLALVGGVFMDLHQREPAG